MALFLRRTAVLALCLGLQAPLAATPPAWSLDQPLYEVNPEKYSAQGTFKAIEQDLPRLKALGAGILWMMPIQARGREKAFNSPYCIRDYDAVHAPYGSRQDFRELVKAAHAQGLHVLMDWVGNHTAWDHPWVKQHPDWYVRDAHGQPQPVKNYSDIFQLDYGNKALRKAMLKSMLAWVKDDGVDGFRCDMAWKVPLDFWVEARAALDKVKPVYLLAEADDAKMAGPFDADYDWNLLPPVKDSELIRLAKGVKGADVVDTALEREVEYPPLPAFARMRGTMNHDQWNDVGAPQELYGPAAPALAVLMATLPGKPLVYNGQEVGWEGRTPGPSTGWDQPADPPIDWSANTQAAWSTRFYTRLLQLYHASPALYRGQFVRLFGEDFCRGYAYLRQDGEDKVLVLLNLGGEPTQSDLEHPYLDGQFRELFSGAALDLRGTVSMRLEPWSYHVYLSGPAADALEDQPFMQGPLAPAWPVSAAPVGGPCAVPVAYPSPVADPKPLDVGCQPAAEGQSLERLDSGVNPDGVRASFKLHWDAEALYLDARILDKKLHSESSDPWENDAVELYLDLKGDRTEAYGDDDFQYILVLDAKEAWEARKRADGVILASTRDEEGWTLSAAVPWATLKHAPKPGEVLGFDLGVDINQDGNGRLGQLMLNGTSDNYKDTRHFSRIRLLPCP